MQEPSELNFVAVSVGNTRTAVGRFESGSLTSTARESNADLDAVVRSISEAWHAVAGAPGAAIIVAAVDDRFATALISGLEGITGEVYRIGEDLDVPIGTQLDPETLTGVDRLLNAAAAYDTFRSACVIVDAGTAVTVDFVDGSGVFQGGAIAPGAAMQLAALHDGTAALPEVAFAVPDDGAFGRNTRQAMLQGVFHGIRGLVWKLVERYATSYGAFPPVIATGGDAQAIFGEDELVDRVIPELTLLGIAAAIRAARGGRPAG
ncbi:MAG TPA: type III pantothenate kinase [Phycisphaerales bacterium]|nr:type III pantothenate kinase [Phycisphaerales bacterium]HMP36875.1 type III pantothenate kinase [Phycisphaerales bacterium]